MRFLLNLILIASLTCGLAACGNKGSLKTPAQIQAEEKKKALETAKKQAKEKAAQSQPAPQEPK